MRGADADSRAEVLPRAYSRELLRLARMVGVGRALRARSGALTRAE